MQKLKDYRQIFIVACGTAMHAGMVGKYVIEKLARKPVIVDIASEFRYRDPIITKDDLMIVISQSGETADTMAVLRLAKKSVRQHWQLSMWSVLPLQEKPIWSSIPMPVLKFPWLQPKPIWYRFR